MIDGQGVVLISYSERYRVELAQPVAQGLSTHGLRAVLIGDEPLPARVKSTPETKINAYFAEAQMVVYLMTPDDRTQDGEVRTRQNIIDELRIGMERGHLKDKLMVFKADKVALPSNVNPVYDRLPLDDAEWIVDRIVRQAREWGLLAKELPFGAPTSPAKSSKAEMAPLRPPASSDAGSLDQARIALAHVQRGLDGEDPDLNALERAQLLVSSLAVEHRNADTIGVLLANRIFTERHALRLLDSERTQLIRTWLRHTTDQNAPGLVWVQDLSKKEIMSLFAALALGDSDNEVRAQALRILGMIRVPVRVAAAKALVETFLSSEHSNLRRAGIDYVRLRGGQVLRRLLDDDRLLAQERSAAREASALLDVGRRPGAVLARFIEDAYSRSGRVREALLGISASLPRSGIVATLRSEAREVVSLGLELSARRADVPFEPLMALIDGQRSRPLRLQALEILIQRGSQIDDGLLGRAADSRKDDTTDFDLDLVADIKRKVFLQRDPSELWDSVGWTALDGPYRYEAAVKLRPSLARQVRTDLRSSFGRLVNQARAEIVDLAAAQALAAIQQPPTDAQCDAIMRAEPLRPFWRLFLLCVGFLRRLLELDGWESVAGCV